MKRPAYITMPLWMVLAFALECAVNGVAFGEDSVGSIRTDGTNRWVRFENAPSHFILECSTNLASTNWNQLSEHRRLNWTNRWLGFEFSINEFSNNMEFWRLRDCAAQ